MNTMTCSAVREAMLDETLGAEERARLEAHVASCAECARVFAAMDELEGAMARMPAIDAPDALVARVIEAARPAEVRPTAERAAMTERDAEPSTAPPSLLWLAVAATASAMLALIRAPLELVRWMATTSRGRVAAAVSASSAVLAASLLSLSSMRSADAVPVALRLPARPEEDGESTGGSTVDVAEGRFEEVDEVRGRLDREAYARLDGMDAPVGAPEPEAMPAQRAAETRTLEPGFLDDGLVLPSSSRGEGGQGWHAGEDDRRAELSQLEQTGREQTTEAPVLDDREGDARGELDVDQSGADRLALAGGLRAQADTDLGGLAREGEDEGEDEDEESAQAPYRASLALQAGDRAQSQSEAAATDHTIVFEPPLDPAFGWWSDAQVHEGLAFHPRDGWWRSTYVPGDPTLPVLRARLEAAGAARLAGLAPLALAESASSLSPVLAAPTDRALAVAVSGDTTAVRGPSRVRVEVALRAIDRAAGRRGPMRVALVIDGQRPLEAAEQARVRALVEGLSAACGGRDRVALIASGVGGGTLVPLSTLRHGPVEVALRSFFGGERSSEPLSTADAVQAGLEAVATEDAIGLVLLLTPDGAHDAALDRVVHAGAVAGVSTSAIGIGDGASLAALDEIATAGQGRRRVITGDADARLAARREVEAAGTRVARGLRIRVRLAPGVQLVDVVGSTPLDVEASRRTREAERAIDTELATRLGIAADRDEDDDGIRIFVPAFHAGDAHSVILDLVVPGPGAVADVDVRFKDLVRLENGHASAALSLAAGTPERGAAQRHVLSALLAQDVSSLLAAAADRASSGDRAGASARIAEAQAHMAAMIAAEPALGRDRAVGALAALLDRCAQAAGDTSAEAALFSDALRLASRRLVVPARVASREP